MNFHLCLNRYPNNIVVIAKPENLDNNNRDVIIVAVESFFTDEDGDLKLSGRAFSDLKPALSSWKRLYHPLKMDLLGCYEASNGLEQEARTWSFSEVRGKCFPFHLTLDAACDPLEYDHSTGRNNPRSAQRWVLLRYMHTSNANTLKPQDIRRTFRKPFATKECGCSQIDKEVKLTKSNRIDLLDDEEVMDDPRYFNNESDW